MNKKYWTRYLPGATRALAYMLQASEYDMTQYWKWLLRLDDMRTVSRRGGLVMTSKAKLVFVFLVGVWVCAWIVIVYLLGAAVATSDIMSGIIAGLVLLLLPWIVALSVVPFVWVGEFAVQRPRERKIIAHTTTRIANHKAHKIAIAGSFGKTTMKETLKTILSVKLDTAATPGNLNTPLGTATFASHLSGDEQVLIFELGEARVGDVAELCDIVQPDEGIITGINEAHLETFGTLERTVETIFELETYLNKKPLYKNAESDLVARHIANDDSLSYSVNGVGDWKVSNIASDLRGIKFTAQRGATTLKLHSGLLGKHQVGPIMACVDIAHRLGLSDEQIVEGVAHTKPFAHRMAPRKVGAAWVIDDTYNGNPQGVAVGLEFLKNLKDGRKIYVTPGLVEQGDKMETVHQAIGKQAAFCDEVILMKNSVTAHIENGLEAADFKGTLRIIDDPLTFYKNIAHYVHAGDIVLMQNDWTDNYA